MDEEEKSDVSPFLKDECDQDWVLEQVGEGAVAATHPHPVPKAQQVLQKDRLLSRHLMFVQFSVANVDLDRGRQIASVGFLQAVKLVAYHLSAVGDFFKHGSEDGLQFSFADADLAGKRHAFFRQKNFQLCEISLLLLGSSLLGEKSPDFAADGSLFTNARREPSSHLWVFKHFSWNFTPSHDNFAFNIPVDSSVGITN